MSGNGFGVLFRVATFGESHGPAIGCAIDGVPPRIALSKDDIQPFLDRRKPGGNRFVTQRREPDEVDILSGVFEGQTTGAPVGLLIRNADQLSFAQVEIEIACGVLPVGCTFFTKSGPLRNAVPGVRLPMS